MKKLLICLCVLFQLAKAQDTITIAHQRYTTTFDRKLYYPVLVHWTVNVADLCDKGMAHYVSRNHYSFHADPKLENYTNLGTDYATANGRYQKGHNDDAKDNTCDATLMEECFCYSNCTPQTPHLNDITWKALEKRTQDLAKTYGSVEVWCGSYGSRGLMGKVTIPQFCWKIIKYGTTIESYIFPNTDEVNNEPFGNYKHSISSIRIGSHLALPGLPNL